MTILPCQSMAWNNWHREIRVKPVTDPLYTWKDKAKKGHTIYPDVRKAAAPVNVYLPKGNKWYDFWSNA